MKRYGLSLLLLPLLLLAACAPKTQSAQPEASEMPVLIEVAPVQTDAPDGAPQTGQAPLPAPDYGENGLFKLTMNETAAYDLNGDGVAEKLTLTLTEDADGDEHVTVSVADEDTRLVRDFDELEYIWGAEGYLADLDPDDGLIEILITGDIGSSDYETLVLRFDCAELTCDINAFSEQSVWGYVLSVHDGMIRTELPVDIVGTWSGQADYALTDGFTFAEPEVYDIDNDGFTDEDGFTRVLTLAKPLDATLLTEDAGEGITLPAGTRMLPVKTDLKSYCTFMLEDRRLISVDVAFDTEAGWGWTINGIPEAEMFEGTLLYAG